MMANLFSPFNPISSSLGSSLWLSMTLTILMFPLLMWVKKSIMINSPVKLMYNLSNQFNTMPNKSIMPSMIMFMSIMMMILTMNIMGLFPYAFPISSHPQITMGISMPMWTAIMMNKSKNMTKTISHLVPPSTPPMLIPFMIIVESISLMIQPLTLAIRLLANITAGHILLSLISEAYTPVSFLPLMSSQSMMMIMELCVALIQAYVMSMLLIMYTK